MFLSIKEILKLAYFNWAGAPVVAAVEVVAELELLEDWLP
jgi:hypothetical protein